MSYGYSDDLRAAALAYYDRGDCTQSEVSDIFGIGLKTLNNWLRQRRETGSFARRETELPRTAYKVDEEALRSYISTHSDAYLYEIAQELSCHPTTVFYACKRMGISRKKNQPVSGA
jgi:transposase